MSIHHRIPLLRKIAATCCCASIPSRTNEFVDFLCPLLTNCESQPPLRTEVMTQPCQAHCECHAGLADKQLSYLNMIHRPCSNERPLLNAPEVCGDQQYRRLQSHSAPPGAKRATSRVLIAERLQPPRGMRYRTNS